MGKYETVAEMPKSGAIRNLSGEDVEEANKAIEDGLVRSVEANAENEKHVKAIKRYLATQNWGCTVKSISGRIYWQVVEKREITPEQKEKMQEGLRRYRESQGTGTPSTEAAAPASSGGNNKAKAAAGK